MPYTSDRKCLQFCIPLFMKTRYLFIVIIFPVILAVSILIGFLLSILYTDTFHKNVVHSINLAENEILDFFDSTSQMLNMLTQHPYVRAADDTIHTYTTETHRIKPSTISKSKAEENISLLFKSIYAGFSDYLDIFMGTEWGGFVTSNKSEVPAGYDPRKRIWYRSGTKAQGEIALTKAFYTHNLNTSVVVLVKSIYNEENSFTGNVAISLSLNTLTSKIAKFGIGAGSSIILMQDDGIILADPAKPQHIFTHIIATDIRQPQRFMQETDRLQRVVFDKKNMFFQVSALSNLPWKLIAFVEEKELWNECTRMLHYIGISGIITVLTLSLLLMMRMLRLSDPIQHILILLQLVSNTAYAQHTMSFSRGDIELLPEHCDTLLNEVRQEIVLITATPDIGA